MKEELLCLGSDAVNRYGFRVDITAFEKLLKDVFDKGTPMLIGHDFHRPIGWNVPFGIFIEPHLGRMISKKIVASDNNELSRIQRAVQNFLSVRYAEKFIPHEKEFLFSIKDFLKEGFERIDCGCASIIQQNIASDIFPDLFNLADDDGLIPLNTMLEQFTYQKQGVFKHKTLPLSVFAHPYFRRAQSRFNNFFFQFLDELLSLQDKLDITLRIRLDEDMIGYAPSFQETGELAFHWGPKYNDEIEQIKTGLCRHECEDKERFFYGISSTEFYWKKDDTEFTAEMEELKDTPSPVTDEMYRCRYIHGMYDTEKKCFFHFDGAIRSYDFETMNDRVGQTFLQFGRKASTYTKLFRVDGKLSVPTWKSLVTHFYQENPLIYEYFGLREERDQMKLEVKEVSALQKLLPYAIKKNEGLRVFISYHSLPEKVEDGRYVDILDVMTAEDKKIYCLEYSIHEVRAVLEQMGEQLRIPYDVCMIKIPDEYWNIPSIMHHGENNLAQLQSTVEALKTLFSAMIEKKVFRIVSLTLSFTFNQRVIRISSYGNIENQLEWLKSNFPFPCSEKGITDWVAYQRKYFEKYSPKEDQLADVLIQSDGVLYVRRRPVLFPFEYEIDNNGELKYKIQFPKEQDQDGIFDMVCEKKLRSALAISIENIFWEDTGENYFTSKRSKWLQNGEVRLAIDQATPLALYWASTKSPED
ncbi:MAG: hypothetical protein ACXVC6_13530 [Bacteroidia bacterium]